jgi:Holliday junction resolvasome RuvABC ATP-dependent DNA helicase subunit
MDKRILGAIGQNQNGRPVDVNTIAIAIGEER